MCRSGAQVGTGVLVGGFKCWGLLTILYCGSSALANNKLDSVVQNINAFFNMNTYI